MEADLDSAIRSTDGSAIHARLSAVRQGYLSDPFVSAFVNRPHLLPTHPPLINIGTHLRSHAIDSLVHQFLTLHSHSKKQLVSLGAGSDTRFWRLAASPLRDHIAAYVELDFPEITATKTSAIRKKDILTSLLGGNIKPAHGGIGLTSSLYHLIPADLRNDPTQVISPLMVSVLSPDLPTLFIAECVFAYMTPEQSGAIIQAFSSNFKVAAGIVYEMFALNDPFGRVMRDNLRARHIELPGVDRFPTLQSQRDRFLNCNYNLSKAWTLREIRKDYVPIDELERVAQLEMLDEIEELDLVLEHYTIACGIKTPINDSSLRSGLEAWGLQARTGLLKADT